MRACSKAFARQKVAHNLKWTLCYVDAVKSEIEAQQGIQHLFSSVHT